MAEVKIYSTPACPYCKMTKDFLEANGISYIDIDVSLNSAAAQEIVTKSGQMGVPVIDIDGQIIVGFDRAGIARALGLN